MPRSAWRLAAGSLGQQHQAGAAAKATPAGLGGQGPKQLRAGAAAAAWAGWRRGGLGQLGESRPTACAARSRGAPSAGRQLASALASSGTLPRRRKHSPWPPAGPAFGRAASCGVAAGSLSNLAKPTCASGRLSPGAMNCSRGSALCSAASGNCRVRSRISAGAAARVCRSANSAARSAASCSS